MLGRSNPKQSTGMLSTFAKTSWKGGRGVERGAAMGVGMDPGVACTCSLRPEDGLHQPRVKHQQALNFAEKN